MDNLNFQYSYKVPDLSKDIKKKYKKKAIESQRKRYPLIIHNKGDEFNQVFNFICIDSYMRPHLHPSDHMIEKMHLIEGSFELFFFNNKGIIIKTYLLNKPGQRVLVPGLQWHTYVMRSDFSIIYETMIGKYDPLTWKTMADWAPAEDGKNSKEYFQSLKNYNG